MTEHTEGPWEIAGQTPQGLAILGPRAATGFQHIVAIVPGPHRGELDSKTIADAHLIAAAPPLLEALEKLLCWACTSQYEKTVGKAEHDDIVKGRARDAIALANGEKGAKA